MEELIKQITEKTGISEEQAKGAVETVANFLKTKLPDALSGHVDSALGFAGGAAQNLDLGSVAGALGGLFGKKD
jgi:tRNA A37 threonylcarbamoyltransferase TsaD